MKLVDLLKKGMETERLALMPISLNWKNDVFREFNADITKYLMGKPAQSISETEDFIAACIDELQNGEACTFVITKKTNNEFLGCTDIQNLKTNAPEIGIWIKKSAHGNKFGFEALTALKQWADIFLDYEHLVYPVDRDNTPSKKIAESLGGKVQKEYDKENLLGNTLHALEYWIFPS